MSLKAYFVLIFGIVIFISGLLIGIYIIPERIKYEPDPIDKFLLYKNYFETMHDIKCQRLPIDLTGGTRLERYIEIIEFAKFEQFIIVNELECRYQLKDLINNSNPLLYCRFNDQTYFWRMKS
jgi:hypothetical protein